MLKNRLLADLGKGCFAGEKEDSSKLDFGRSGEKEEKRIGEKKETDHGAETVDTAQRTSMETFPRSLVSDFFFKISIFLDCFSIECEKKGKEQ